MVAQDLGSVHERYRGKRLGRSILRVWLGKRNAPKTVAVAVIAETYFRKRKAEMIAFTTRAIERQDIYSLNSNG